MDIFTFLRNFWFAILVVAVVGAIYLRTADRGYFWKAKDGRQLNIREFFKTWGKGIEGITPLQQTTTTLWSYPLIIGGIVTGLVILAINKTWWMWIILLGSLPITLMQIISVYQKYSRLKQLDKTMKELNPIRTETGGNP